jgi:hypothetical protein
MYQKPMVERFGTFRELTQAGCTGGSDGQVFQGAGSIGSTPTFSGSNPVTTDYCFVTPVGSR